MTHSEFHVQIPKKAAEAVKLMLDTNVSIEPACQLVAEDCMPFTTGAVLDFAMSIHDDYNHNFLAYDGTSLDSYLNEYVFNYIKYRLNIKTNELIHKLLDGTK